MALPPYIEKNRKKTAPQHYKDKLWYQTDWAQKMDSKGSLASPTASLHFKTSDLHYLAEKKGVKLAPLTLHVGLGTFLPLRDLQNHKMHRERVSIPQKTLEILEKNKDKQHALWALGTTVTRGFRKLRQGLSKRRCFSKSEKRTSPSFSNDHGFIFKTGRLFLFRRPLNDQLPPTPLHFACSCRGLFRTRGFEKSLQNGYRSKDEAF